MDGNPDLGIEYFGECDDVGGGSGSGIGGEFQVRLRVRRACACACAVACTCTCTCACAFACLCVCNIVFLFDSFATKNPATSEALVQKTTTEEKLVSVISNATI